MRRALSVVLLALACLLVPLGTLSVWARYEVGDSDRYVATMAPLAAEPAVRGAVADAVTNGIVAQLDAGPLQSAVDAFVHDAVKSFTGTEAFQTAWNTANRAAHDAVQQAVDDGTDGPVTLDLAPVTGQVRQQLSDDGVPFANRIPVTHTTIIVMNSRDLERLRESLLLLQRAGLWLPFAAFISAATGLALARRRRRALTATALGVALAAAALLVALAMCRSLTLDNLPSDVGRSAAGAAYDALSSSVRTASLWTAGTALTVALCTWLPGRLRHRPAPHPPAPPEMRPAASGVSMPVTPRRTE
ncbi:MULTISPECIES: hypothetical protein [unclassified Streptomyces]|uniref:hypothetical protein n=1 Tax=unclassified Streptomyces TaxID=2593676 RepID=UPI002E3511AF|nr:hypothetical protein [Streptomyces sp. NBC_01280]WSE20007.1 hypothetical protein OG518_23980 [Streptomyces sp. NBC_01397]